jgi:hypothetical protein
LSICPTEETFLTSSIDDALRLWDVCIRTAQVKNKFFSNLLNFGFIFKDLLSAQTTSGPNSRPVAKFDPEDNLILYLIFKIFFYSFHIEVWFLPLVFNHL